MSAAQQAINIDLRTGTGVRNQIPVISTGIVMSCLLFAALEALIFRTFALADSDVDLFAMSAAGIVVILLLTAANMIAGERNKYGKVLVAVGFVISFLVLALVFRRDFQYGLNCYADQMSLIRVEATGRIQRRFDTGADPTGAVRVFSVFVTALAAAVAYVIACEGKKITTVLVSGLLLGGVVMQVIPPDIFFLTAIGMLLITVEVKFLLDNSALMKKKAIAVNGAGLLVLLSIMALLVAFLPWQDLFSQDVFRDKIEGFVHSTRYEENANPLPEGDLRNVEAFKPTGRISLTVEMEKPEALYLRGFVGDRYADGRWNRLEGEFYRKNGDLFYWLHKGGFYGQSQRAMLNKLINDADVEKMKVTNVSACRKYTYAPYGLYQKDKVISDRRSIGDSDIKGRKEKAVSMHYIPGTVYESYRLQSDYTTGVDVTEELAAYRDEETAYRELIYENYMEIPEDIENMLISELGEKEQLSTTEAKLKIRKYLDENISYRTHIAGNKGKELITWFLGERKAGYSVHYAAASAMMLRYYGVPARYVEGYMVSSEDAEDMGKNASYPVTEKNAHAWAEYYLDGVGWIPFESVPGKKDAGMYAAAGTTRTEKGGEGVAGKKDTSEQEDKDKNDEEEKVSDKTNFNNPVNSWRWIFVFRKIWAYLLAGLMLVMAATYVVIKRIRLGRFTGTFTGEDIRKGIINSFAYASFLAKRKDGLEGSGISPRAVRINDIALYSTLDMNKDQQAEMVEMKNVVLKEYKSGRSVLQKFYDRFIACIY